MSNLQYIKNSDINRKKWDKCISESFNSRVYGLSWYLDIVCENWDGIVFEDYEGVFPVIFKKRFFLKKSYHPFFCQQLGLFCKNKNFINYDTIKPLHSCISKHFPSLIFHKVIPEMNSAYPGGQYIQKPNQLLKYTYCTTAEFLLKIDELMIVAVAPNILVGTPQSARKIMFGAYAYERINLELDLNLTYKNIQSLYTNNTIRNLKRSKSFNLKVQKDIDVSLFIDVYKTNKKIKNSIQNFFSFSDNYLIIKDLISACLKQDRGQLIGVIDQEGNIISAAFFLSCFNRYIMLFNVTQPGFKKYHGMTFLIDDFISSNSNQKKVLDFEGSNMAGVRNFYYGFGSVNKPYYLFIGGKPDL